MKDEGSEWWKYMWEHHDIQAPGLYMPILKRRCYAIMASSSRLRAVKYANASKHPNTLLEENLKLPKLKSRNQC
jgi:hypothetical protein